MDEPSKDRIGRPYIDWETEACETCYRLGYEYTLERKEDEYPAKWLCVGSISPPDEPKDDHERYNRIRLCVVQPTDENPDQLSQFDWPPFARAAASRLGPRSVE